MPTGPDPQPPSSRATVALFELLGRRWALRLLWELRDAPRSFTDLRASCGISGSVLAQRLDELRDAGLVEPAAEGGYAVTGAGRSLLAQLDFIDGWAAEWARTARGVGGRTTT